MHSGAVGMTVRRTQLCRSAAISRKLAHVLLATLETYVSMRSAHGKAAQHSSARNERSTSNVAALFWELAMHGYCDQVALSAPCQAVPNTALLRLQGGMLAPLRGTEMPMVRLLVEMEAEGIAMNEAVIRSGGCLGGLSYQGGGKGLEAIVGSEAEGTALWDSSDRGVVSCLIIFLSQFPPRRYRPSHPIVCSRIMRTSA